MKLSQTRRTYYIFLVSLVISAIYSYFFVDKSVGISGTIFYSLLVASIWGYKLISNKRFNLYDLIFVLLIFASFGEFLHQNKVLNNFTSGVLVFSFVPVSLLSLYPKKFRRFSFLNAALAYLYGFFSGFVAIPTFLRGFVPVKTNDSKNKKVISLKLYHILQVMVGVVIALPILLVFFVLFMSADQAFGELVGKIDIDFSSGHLSAFILFYFLYSFILGGLLIKKLNLIVVDQNYSRTIKKGVPLIVSSTIISLIALLFLTFIGVQFYYLFGDHGKVVDLGLTYSEYARRGFWELQAISIFSFAIIYFLQRFTVVSSKRARLLVNILLSIFIIQVLIVLYSAHKRMSLYEDGYGFTELRFYPHVFMLYEAMLFGYLMISLYAGKIFKHFSIFSFGLGLVFVIVLNFLNPNQYIAKKNIGRYEDGKTLDVKYLMELSPDAYIELEDVGFETYDMYRCELLSLQDELEKRTDNWTEFNVAGQNSIEVVDDLTEGLSAEQCRQIVEERVNEFFADYSSELESGDFKGALSYWAYDQEDVSLVNSIPASFKVEDYGYSEEIHDTYFKYDEWFDEDIVKLEDFRFLSDFDEYTGQSVELKYSNSYGTYCKTDYVALDIVNGEIVIDRSSGLPLRYSSDDERNSYDTKGNMINTLKSLADNSVSTCSYYMR